MPLEDAHEFRVLYSLGGPRPGNACTVACLRARAAGASQRIYISQNAKSSAYYVCGFLIKDVPNKYIRCSASSAQRCGQINVETVLCHSLAISHRLVPIVVPVQHSWNKKWRSAFICERQGIGLYV